MRKLTYLALAGCLLGLAGCAGSDNNADEVAIFLTDWSNAIENRNINAYASLISSSYLDDCTVKADLVSAASATFDDPTITQLRYFITGDVIVTTLPNNYDDFSAPVEVRYRRNGVLHIEPGTFRNTIHLEGGRWLLVGDGLCTAGSQKADVHAFVP